MSELILKNLVKVYPYTKITGLFHRKQARAKLEAQKQMPYTTNEGVLALQDVSLTIEDGEFLVILGASGSGKSTLLRMIAGLESVSAGEVWMDGENITHKPSNERNMAMVFQNYSLYPGFTVYENIAFPLQNEHMPREQIDATVKQMAELLGISDKLNRMPRELSGGQLQRVALGRALVRKPKLFLLDEPFSNLDAPLRQSLRDLVKELHEHLGTTFLYVTHDQYEAFSLGTKIVLLKDGMVEQYDTPEGLYNRPANRYVASFIGQPGMNFIEHAPIHFDKGWYVTLFGEDYPLQYNFTEKPKDAPASVTIGIRPGSVEVDRGNLSATIRYVEPLASEVCLHLNIQGTDFDVVIPESSNLFRFQKNTDVRISLNPERFYVFDDDDSEQ